MLKRKSKLKTWSFIFALILITLNPLTFSSRSKAQTAPATGDPNASELQARADLEKKIQDQNLELQKLNQQMLETQNKLKTATTERVSLQKELNTIKTSINGLNLSIKSDEVSINKLNLEIDSISYDIADTGNAIAQKKASVMEVLKQIQKNADNHKNLITVLLRGQTLAESVFEAQALADTSGQLTADVADLQNLSENLQTQKQAVSSKKSEITTRQQTLVAKKSIIQDQEAEKASLLANTKNQESAYQKELADLKKKQNDIANQIDAIEAELKAKFNYSQLPQEVAGVLSWPIKLKKDGGIGIITQHFGELSNLYNGKPHNGMDIGVPIGTPVYAAADGKVIGADNNDQSRTRKYQYGTYIMIEHANNLATLYGHLSKQVVGMGTTVKRGDLIGYSGNTGYSTGPHLHFGLYWAPSVTMKSIPPAAGLVPIGVVIDPLNYL